MSVPLSQDRGRPSDTRSAFDNLAAKGRKLLDQHRETLTRIERQFVGIFH